MGRDEEAAEEVRRAAKMNGVPYPEDLMKEQTTHLVKDKVLFINISLNYQYGCLVSVKLTNITNI